MIAAEAGSWREVRAYASRTAADLPTLDRVRWNSLFTDEAIWEASGYDPARWAPYTR